MALNDVDEYAKARNDSEPRFVEKINTSFKYGLTMAMQIFDDDIDMEYHADCILLEQNKSQLVLVDVKHIKEKNFKHGNYSLSKACILFLLKHKIENHRLAFRLVEKDISNELCLSDNFLYAKTIDVLRNCSLKINDVYYNFNDIEYEQVEKAFMKEHSTYALVNIDDIKKK